jgi:hypothetical protein
MKANASLWTLAFLTATLASLHPSQAYASNAGKGGGELLGVSSHPRIQRIGRDLIEYLNHHARPWLVRYLKELDQLKAGIDATDPNHAMLLSLLEQGLIEDVQNSQYELKQRCTDENGSEKAMSTTIGTRNATVCISPARLLSQMVQIAELKNPTNGISGYEFSDFIPTVIGLLAHEHVRHFSIEDTDATGSHPIGTFVASTYGVVASGYYRGSKGTSGNETSREGEGLSIRLSEYLTVVAPGSYRIQLRPATEVSKKCLNQSYEVQLTSHEGNSSYQTVALNQPFPFTINRGTSKTLTHFRNSMATIFVTAKQKGCRLDVLMTRDSGIQGSGLWVQANTWPVFSTDDPNRTSFKGKYRLPNGETMKELRPYLRLEFELGNWN